MINNCIYCNSADNLNTQLSLKLEDGTIAKVSVCDTHAEDATIKSAREKYIEKTNQLKQFLEQAKQLGIDIGSYDILSEYSKEIKSRNFAFLIGLDFLKSSFSVKNQYFKSIRNDTIKKINSSSFIKNVFFNIANKGFKF